MNGKIVSLLMLLLAGSCTHRRPVAEVGGVVEKPKKISHVKPKVLKEKTKPLKTPTKESKPVTKTRVFWRLVGDEEVVIRVRELDVNKKSTPITLTQGFSFHDLTAGSWEIVGFDYGDSQFAASLKAEKIVFKVSKNKTSYAGAILMDCPKVGKNFIEELKTMKFFNRYTFTSTEQECEMVVGNDFSSVEQEWKELETPKGPKLELGL